MVGVNPYNTKKAKKLDGNSPTKNDKNDALTIARLVKDGRYFTPYLPSGVYAELRALSNNRASEMKCNNAVKNTITAILDEYFPELTEVFKYPLKDKAFRQVLKSCPFPSLILSLGEDGVLAEIRKSVKWSVGLKRRMNILKNKVLIKQWGSLEKRRAFLEAYKDWGLWLTTPELNLSYYRYLLPNGTAIIAMEHQQHTYLGHDESEWQSAVRYYVQKSGEPFSPKSCTSFSVVTEMLKDAKISLQKRGD